MSKVIIIGAGGVGRVVAYKCAQHPEVFSEIMLASRTVSKCEQIAAGVVNRELVVYDKVEWIKKYVDPSVVVNCTFTGSQKAAYAQKKNVLIDDRPKNIEAWEAAGGIGILHTSAAETIEQLKKLRKKYTYSKV